MERKDRKHGYNIKDEGKYLSIEQLIIEWGVGR